jgi:hypothetical protein
LRERSRDRYDPVTLLPPTYLSLCVDLLRKGSYPRILSSASIPLEKVCSVKEIRVPEKSSCRNKSSGWRGKNERRKATKIYLFFSFWLLQQMLQARVFTLKTVHSDDRWTWGWEQALYSLSLFLARSLPLFSSWFLSWWASLVVKLAGIHK